MKKKIILLLLIILVISITIVALKITKCDVLADTNSKIDPNTRKILTGEKVNSINDTYVEDFSSEKDSNFSSDLNLANKIIEQHNINSLTKENSKTDDLKVKNYNNEIEGRKETVMYNKNFSITINKDKGKLISYISNKTSFQKNNLTKENIQNAAKSIFKQLNIDNSDKYELNYIEKFDDEIWRAGFVEKDENLLNIYNSVKFSFAPQSNELVTLAINNIEYANNGISVSKETADKIVQNYLSKSVANEISSSDVEIVRPNYFFENKSSGSIYVNIPQTRKAYVYTFNNKSESKVYIDCTTGEVIGGDKLLGGEF